jgi:drug/metabolite transporter (DMT)-like permease
METTNKSKININPYLEVAIAGIIWGSTGALVKYLALPATTLTFIRLIIPTLYLGLLFYWQKTNIFKANYKWMLFTSLLNAIRMYLYFLAFSHTSIGNAVIILYTWPVFATFFSSIILKEKISAARIILLFVAFTGIILIYSDKPFSFSNHDFLGMTAMLFSGIIYSLTVILFKKFGEHYNNQEIIFFQNLLGCFIFFPFFITNQPFPSFLQIIISIGYAILNGLVGFGLFFSAIRKISIFKASLLSHLEVITGIGMGVFFFSEPLTWHLMIGGSLIIASALMLNKKMQQFVAQVRLFINKTGGKKM